MRLAVILPEEQPSSGEPEDVPDAYASRGVGWAARLFVIVPAALLYIAVGILAWSVGPPFRGVLIAQLLAVLVLLVWFVRSVK